MLRAVHQGTIAVSGSPSSGIALTHTDGTAFQELTFGYDGQADWSPDGARIA